MDRDLLAGGIDDGCHHRREITAIAMWAVQ
jgi:hypothetical protein